MRTLSRDLIGEKIGNLTVIEYDTIKRNLVCRCDCGNTVRLRASVLKRGDILSCGCPCEIDFTGQKIKSYTVLGYNSGNEKWRCQCECGKIIEVKGSRLKNKNIRECKHIEDLTGHIFSKLTVIKYNPYTQRWICQCECGKTTEANPGDLLRGYTRSCGCLLSSGNLSRREDLTGQKFGKLTALRYNKDTKKWVCQCDCGNFREVSKTDLKYQKATSCGCLGKGKPREDLTGRKFNMLTAIRYNEKTKKWLCRCDCGKRKEVDTYLLKAGSTKSCGCLRKRRAKVK